MVGLYNRYVDVDRLPLAERLDDVAVGLRRLTLDRRGLRPTAAATLTTPRRSGPRGLTDPATTQGASQPSMTAPVARPAGAPTHPGGTR